MLKVYLKTPTKLGYIYMGITDSGELVLNNIVKNFTSQYEVKNHIVELTIQSLKFQLDSFISIYTLNNSPETDLDSKSIDTLKRFNTWINENEKPLDKLCISINKRKEEFVNLAKSSGNRKDDLIMIYKLIFEEVDKHLL